jgi:hypothetical protein
MAVLIVTTVTAALAAWNGMLARRGVNAAIDSNDLLRKQIAASQTAQILVEKGGAMLGGWNAHVTIHLTNAGSHSATNVEIWLLDEKSGQRTRSATAQFIMAGRGKVDLDIPFAPEFPDTNVGVEFTLYGSWTDGRGPQPGQMLGLTVPRR